MKKDGTEIIIEGDLLLNPDDYDYMDSLPIEGWIWEFIRRNSTYNKIYSAFAMKKIEPTGVYLLLRRVREDIAIRPIIKPCKNLDKRHFSWIEIPKLENDCAGLPNPSTKSHEFAALKPQIIGLTPVVLYKPDKYERRGIKAAHEFFPISRRHYVPKEYCDEMVNNILPPVDVRNTIYLGISEYANKDNVRKIFESIVQNWIGKRNIRFRDESWRVSLFIFDLFEKLKERYPLRYEKFTTALTDTYPFFKITRYEDGKKVRGRVDSRDYFDESKCRRFYDKARSLIKGDYKKYLYLQ